MFEKYNFEFLRLRYVKGAMTNIPSFRPDGKTPADCDTLMTSATTARTTGAHEYKIIPRNSRGDGPESAVSVVNVS